MRRFTGADVAAFHRSGLALTVTRNEDGGYEPGLFVQATDPPEQIEGGTPEEIEAARIEYARRRGEVLE